MRRHVIGFIMMLGFFIEVAFSRKPSGRLPAAGSMGRTSVYR